MSRQASSEAQTQLGTANDLSTGNSGTAAGALNTVEPFYQKELSNPQGFSAQQLANQMTSSDQTLGGSTAAVAGAGDLAAERNRNSAGVAPAVDAAARAASAQQSTNNLNIQNASANLANQHQQQGAEGMSSIYGTSLSAALNALGLGTNAINAQTAADAQTTQAWQGPLDAGLQAGGVAAAGAGK